MIWIKSYLSPIVKDGIKFPFQARGLIKDELQLLVEDQRKVHI